MLERFEKFIYDITEIDLYWHRLATSVMKEYGLRGNYAVYFVVLHKAPEGLTSAELAAACGKDKADVSRDLNALEKAGLLQRICTGDNRYRARVTLTEKGATLTTTIRRKAETAVNCIGGNLSDADRECFYRVLDEITANMQALSQSGLPEE